jgi:hypothetical protein
LNAPAPAATEWHTPGHETPHQSWWLWVLCLTGVDYFSTLAYQPSIAFAAAGRLAPFATLFLVLVTLGGAVPIYQYVAGRSPRGLGSIAMLEDLLAGWWSKLLVLGLLGFAATDFIITITLSSADAVEHLVHNPLWADAPHLLHNTVLLTSILLVSLGALFLRGFREVIGVAVVVVTLFLVLNAIVILAGLYTLAIHPEFIAEWWGKLAAGRFAISEGAPELTGWGGAFLISVLLFPKLALGLSGFETGVAVMPLVEGDPGDDPHHPAGRIRNTRTLLLTAAVVMSVFLLGSSLVVVTLIPAADLMEEGPAVNRALAYLAHAESPKMQIGWLGEGFGTLYDISTIAILWLAGASALSGLLNLIPRYLPRYGMAPTWAEATRPLVAVLVAVCLVVTWLFQADVEAQGAAYATGVMVLILSACVAVTIDRWRHNIGAFAQRFPWREAVITLVFAYTATAILFEKPDGAIIAVCFVTGIMVVSITSRILRSGELRVVKFEFANPESQFLWETLQHLDIPVIAPHRPGGRTLAEKERELRLRHRLTGDVPIVFIEASIGDPSDFYQVPLIEVLADQGTFVVRVTRCTSIAPVLASIALSLAHASQTLEIHFGWSDENPLRTNLSFLLFGEGNIPWLVRDLIRKAQPDDAKRPRVVIG